MPVAGKHLQAPRPQRPTFLQEREIRKTKRRKENRYREEERGAQKDYLLGGGWKEREGINWRGPGKEKIGIVF